MTRKIVYSIALGAFVCTTAMTIASITTPYWISYSVTADNSGATYGKHLGLHQSCSSLDDPPCRHFPDDDDCRGDQFFCSMWRSSGFLLSFATIVELATLITFLVVMAGGKYKRETGWKLIGAFLLADAAVEFAGMGLVVSRNLIPIFPHRIPMMLNFMCVRVYDIYVYAYILIIRIK